MSNHTNSQTQLKPPPPALHAQPQIGLVQIL